MFLFVMSHTCTKCILTLKLPECQGTPCSKEARQQVSKSIAVIPANIYLFIFNNRNTRKRCEICLKLTIKVPDRRLYSF